MKQVGLFEAKQKLSELIERAEHGERIGITRRGKLAAVIVPAESSNSADIKEIFADIDRVRARIKPLPEGTTIKDLIEEGRR